MDGSVQMPSRNSAGQFERRLTPTQDRWLLKAWRLRRKLCDKQLAARLGISRGQLQHHLIRVRKGM